jgi:hypothetical protein
MPRFPRTRPLSILYYSDYTISIYLSLFISLYLSTILAPLNFYSAAFVDAVLSDGADRARAIAAETMRHVRSVSGLQ